MIFDFRKKDKKLPDNHFSHQGQTREVIDFCLFPVKLKDGRWAWLEFVKLYQRAHLRQRNFGFYVKWKTLNAELTHDCSRYDG